MKKYIILTTLLITLFTIKTTTASEIEQSIEPTKTQTQQLVTTKPQDEGFIGKLLYFYFGDVAIYNLRMYYAQQRGLKAIEKSKDSMYRPGDSNIKWAFFKARNGYLYAKENYLNLAGFVASQVALYYLYADPSMQSNTPLTIRYFQESVIPRIGAAVAFIVYICLAELFLTDPVPSVWREKTKK